MNRREKPPACCVVEGARHHFTDALRIPEKVGIVEITALIPSVCAFIFGHFFPRKQDQVGVIARSSRVPYPISNLVLPPWTVGDVQILLFRTRTLQARLKDHNRKIVKKNLDGLNDRTGCIRHDLIIRLVHVIGYDLTFDRCSIDINPSDVDEAAPAMAASGHQIGEPDLVDSS